MFHFINDNPTFICPCFWPLALQWNSSCRIHLLYK